ncbi:hypothetical protein NQ036_04555 [Brevibacterium sp. 91QC2O2]|uniref:hypothetical protein n=1 Tax=Brevibacterium TaxID=1696 RepID=UPI00211C66B9|nr:MULTISPECIES: hypothetical protein [unclassified Brevibacterium]MCQ9367522.1 hypothetical protein [Brevibacterium sp. 91QC2O2]MCQ9386343.1 hypothetical protein [Brevibacterium sp. 68QC2CO]
MTIQKKLRNAVGAVEDTLDKYIAGPDVTTGQRPGYVEDDSEKHLREVADAHGDRLLEQPDGSHIVEEVSAGPGPEIVREYPAGDQLTAEAEEAEEAAEVWEHDDAVVDEWEVESFPASDPPASDPRIG